VAAAVAAVAAIAAADGECEPAGAGGVPPEPWPELELRPVRATMPKPVPLLATLLALLPRA
jgi:hypothetical protein